MELLSLGDKVDVDVSVGLRGKGFTESVKRVAGSPGAFTTKPKGHVKINKKTAKKHKKGK